MTDKCSSSGVAEQSQLYNALEGQKTFGDAAGVTGRAKDVRKGSKGARENVGHICIFNGHFMYCLEFGQVNKRRILENANDR